MLQDPANDLFAGPRLKIHVKSIRRLEDIAKFFARIFMYDIQFSHVESFAKMLLNVVWSSSYIKVDL